MALTKNNPEGEFAQRWKQLVADIDEGLFDLELLKQHLQEREYKLLIDMAKKL